MHPQLTVVLATERTADLHRRGEWSRLARSPVGRSSQFAGPGSRRVGVMRRVLVRGRRSLEATR